MIRLQEFSSTDEQDKLTFLKNTDLKARGFNIISVFQGIETVEQMRVKIKELKDLSDKNPCERKFYYVLNSDQPIGVVTLRTNLDDFLLHNVGHIGIAIDKTYRGRNFGTEAFKKMCEKANREYGIKEIVVMALIDNGASRAMIEKSGGKYQDTITAVDGERLARYRVKCF